MGVSLTAITATDSKGKIYKTISTENGFYRLWLPTEKYRVEFNKHEFKRLILADFEDVKRINKTFDANLEPGICSDCNGSPDSGEIENIRKSDEVDFSKPKEKIGILNGVATDEFGAGLPNLVVKFTNEIGEIFQTLTDEEGKFTVKLPYETYKINTIFQDLLKNQERKIKINKFENKTERIILSCKYKDRKKCFVS